MRYNTETLFKQQQYEPVKRQGGEVGLLDGWVLVILGLFLLQWKPAATNQALQTEANKIMGLNSLMFLEVLLLKNNALSLGFGSPLESNMHFL